MSCNLTLSQLTSHYEACFQYLLPVISKWHIIQKSRINVLILYHKYFSLWSFSFRFYITSQLNDKLFGQMLLVFAYRNSWRVYAFKFHKPMLVWSVFIFLKHAFLNASLPIPEKYFDNKCMKWEAKWEKRGRGNIPKSSSQAAVVGLGTLKLTGIISRDLWP